MSDPQAVRAAALAAVDRRISRQRDVLAVAGGNVVDYSPGRVQALVDDLHGLEGRRRILERHAPMECVNAFCPESHWCGGCDPDGDKECWNVRWPCPDWLDAAAGLPLEGTE